MQFDQLPLLPSLIQLVCQLGYEEPTPVQAQAIPHILEGHDLLGAAQTGTGKTAAFALPIIQRLSSGGDAGATRPIRALVLTPTRELASQVGEAFQTYSKGMGLRTAMIYGGVRQFSQVRKLREGVDVIVATPGRLIDLKEQRHLRLDKVEVFVLDEADRMLDMGFIYDIRRIASFLPEQRQNLMFSATMPADIQNLANDILRDPVEVRISPPSATVDLIEQRVCFVEKAEKVSLLAHFLKDPAWSRVLTFVRTKDDVDWVDRRLRDAGVSSVAIHGDKPQEVRTAALDALKQGSVKILVATDVAARGLDVDDISHVVNFDLPQDIENYVHRIGRTGRAGQDGISVSFCSADERMILLEIERFIGKHLERIEDHPFRSPLGSAPKTVLSRKEIKANRLMARRLGRGRGRR